MCEHGQVLGEHEPSIFASSLIPFSPCPYTTEITSTEHGTDPLRVGRPE